MVYFRTYAKEIGCKNVDKLGDLAVWNWIREYEIITVWECKDAKTKAWKHNHIEQGYDANVTSPNPRNPLQEKAWKGSKWHSVESHITCYNVVKRGKVEWTDKIPQF